MILHCLLHVSRHFHKEMSSEWCQKHLCFYPERMNLNLALFYVSQQFGNEISGKWKLDAPLQSLKDLVSSTLGQELTQLRSSQSYTFILHVAYFKKKTNNNNKIVTLHCPNSSRDEMGTQLQLIEFIKELPSFSFN